MFKRLVRRSRESKPARQVARLYSEGLRTVKINSEGKLSYSLNQIISVDKSITVALAAMRSALSSARNEIQVNLQVYGNKLHDFTTQFELLKDYANERLITLKQEIARLKAENSALEQKSADDFKDREADLLWKHNRELNDVRSKLEKKLSEEKNVSKELRKDLAEEKAHSKDLKRKNTRLRKEIRRLRDSNTTAKVEELTARNAKLTAELEERKDLEKKRQVRHEAQVDELSRRLREKTRKLRDTEARLDRCMASHRQAKPPVATPSRPCRPRSASCPSRLASGPLRSLQTADPPVLTSAGVDPATVPLPPQTDDEAKSLATRSTIPPRFVLRRPAALVVSSVTPVPTPASVDPAAVPLPRQTEDEVESLTIRSKIPSRSVARQPAAQSSSSAKSAVNVSGPSAASQARQADINLDDLIASIQRLALTDPVDSLTAMMERLTVNYLPCRHPVIQSQAKFADAALQPPSKPKSSNTGAPAKPKPHFIVVPIQPKPQVTVVPKQPEPKAEPAPKREPEPKSAPEHTPQVTVAPQQPAPKPASGPQVTVGPTQPKPEPASNPESGDTEMGGMEGTAPTPLPPTGLQPGAQGDEMEVEYEDKDVPMGQDEEMPLAPQGGIRNDTEMSDGPPIEDTHMAQAAALPSAPAPPPSLPHPPPFTAPPYTIPPYTVPLHTAPPPAAAPPPSTPSHVQPSPGPVVSPFSQRPTPRIPSNTYLANLAGAAPSAYVPRTPSLLHRSGGFSGFAPRVSSPLNPIGQAGSSSSPSAATRSPLYDPLGRNTNLTGQAGSSSSGLSPSSTATRSPQYDPLGRNTAPTAPSQSRAAPSPSYDPRSISPSTAPIGNAPTPIPRLNPRPERAPVHDPEAIGPISAQINTAATAIPRVNQSPQQPGRSQDGPLDPLTTPATQIPTAATSRSPVPPATPQRQSNIPGLFLDDRFPAPASNTQTPPPNPSSQDPDEDESDEDEDDAATARALEAALADDGPTGPAVPPTPRQIRRPVSHSSRMAGRREPRGAPASSNPPPSPSVLTHVAGSSSTLPSDFAFTFGAAAPRNADNSDKKPHKGPETGDLRAKKPSAGASEKERAEREERLAWAEANYIKAQTRQADALTVAEALLEATEAEVAVDELGTEQEVLLDHRVDVAFQRITVAELKKDKEKIAAGQEEMRLAKMKLAEFRMNKAESQNRQWASNIVDDIQTRPTTDASRPPPSSNSADTAPGTTPRNQSASAPSQEQPRTPSSPNGTPQPAEMIAGQRRKKRR